MNKPSTPFDQAVAEAAAEFRAELNKAWADEAAKRKQEEAKDMKTLKIAVAILALVGLIATALGLGFSIVL